MGGADGGKCRMTKSTNDDAVVRLYGAAQVRRECISPPRFPPLASFPHAHHPAPATPPDAVV